jgi:hypothetical protein
MMRAAGWICGLALALSLLLPLAATAEPISVTTREISEFRIGRAEPTFGRFTFVGGLELVGNHRDFGGFSAFRFLDKGRRFLGVSDTGFWFSGEVERDAASGHPVGIRDFTMEAIPGPEGQRTSKKALVDAEGLALWKGEAVVSFEREHRVTRYSLPKGSPPRPLGNVPFLIPRHELRLNRGLETILAAPATSVFGDALLVVSEMSLNPAGDLFAAVLFGPRKGIFYVKRRDNFDVTDGAFLPNGDILLLERRFSYASGVAMRLRSLAAASIKADATVDGEILLQADMGYQIDNMEGLDVWQAPDGSTRVSIISDDNQSFLQRNLYLEFIYADD